MYSDLGNGVTLILIKIISSRYIQREAPEKVFGEKVRNSVTEHRRIPRATMNYTGYGKQILA